MFLTLTSSNSNESLDRRSYSTSSKSSSLCQIGELRAFSIQTSLLNNCHLLHKTGFVPTKVSTTVCIIYRQICNIFDNDNSAILVMRSLTIRAET